ncbi:MAG: adenosine deaminase, partial [Rhizobacter sp.]|nr:adenosine deaminase [Rhizobacter sp.]
MDADAAYLALVARDARFDGHWFVGVTSTGVYCRPICRVRTPMRRNCRFFDSAAQAEADSFRPCLKCRPELAPGRDHAWTTMDASVTLARQAAQWLDAQVDSLATPSVAALADRLGISDRHLRRIFLAEHGVTPLAHLQTRRLLLAKHLLTDTAMPVSQVALASGFGSLRRFNAAFTENYRMSPSRLRKGSVEGDAGAVLVAATANAARRSTATAPLDAITVTLAYRPPYDIAAMLHFIATHAIGHVEQVQPRGTRRTLRAGAIEGAPAGWIEAEFVEGKPQVRLRYAPLLAPHSAAVVRSARRWFDLDASPDAIDAVLHDLPHAPGLRLPGSLDAFELAVRAVLGQQVSVAAGQTIARRLVERFGDPIQTPWEGTDMTFPSPSKLAAATADDIGVLGIFSSRIKAILALAREWPSLAPMFDIGHAPEPLIHALDELPGIGPWTAHYIAMRALGFPDAWPPGDIAVDKAIAAHFGVTGKPAILAHARRWQPWRAYAVMRLWNHPVPVVMPELRPLAAVPRDFPGAPLPTA